MKTISGFSKLTKEDKLNWLANNILAENDIVKLKEFWHKDHNIQKTIDEFSENTLTNFMMPFGIAPNFKIDDKVYHIPMVIEESSVVAAASKSAKFWLSRGGFKTKIIDMTKVGQVHFIYKGNKEKLYNFFNLNKAAILNSTQDVTKNMDKRGGGIKDMTLEDKTVAMNDYFVINLTFNTCDAMGANFINSVLEKIANEFTDLAQSSSLFNEEEKNINIIMSILSNYTPNCKVKAYVECPIEELGSVNGISANVYAEKFYSAVQIAKVNVDRAVTHNKGIMNGIDALILATGNDFRAVEACAHAYAARDGQYRSLSSCTLEDGIFKFELEIPLALGTIGGLTSLHPLSKLTLKILEGPNAETLMKIVACVGLAQNFGAINSLVTTGIQKGHMKMHLLNILNQLKASDSQIVLAKSYFEDKIVSFQSVRDFLDKQNNLH
jgi:hydroxymethylglutaryl-CoA reductase